MKKIFHLIVSAIIAALIVPACMTMEQDIPHSNIPGLSKDATLTMGFCVPSGAATRAVDNTDMDATPYIESMHVFIFDGEGTLLQVRQATLGTTSVVANYDSISVATNAGAMVSHWMIDNVSMSVEKRILHFVANLPDDRVPKTGSESSIFRSLSVAYPRAAYWQRIELPNGIEPYMYDGSGTYSYIDEDGVLQEDVAISGVNPSDNSYVDGNGFTVNNGDYIDRNGNKIVNGTGYFYVPDVDSPLRQMIPLVRNFVSITFIDGWDAFTLKKIALVNTPAEGLVAPFSASAPDKFESEYLWSPSWRPGAAPNHNDVLGHNYAPLLASAGMNNQPVPVGFTNVDGTSVTLYMYERGLPKSDATSLLIGGALAGYTGPKDSEGNVWFRIDIVDSNKEYYNFYRNFTYTMTLTGIANAEDHCHRTASEALSHVPVGDISNSAETADLTQINDGAGFYLWVSYVDYQHLGGDTSEVVPLIYTLFHDNGSTNTYYCEGVNDRITFTQKASQSAANAPFATSDIQKRGVISSSSNSTYLTQVPNPAYTWYLAEVTLKPGSTSVLRNDIEIVGNTLAGDAAGYHKLTRLVTYTVTSKQKLGLSVTPIAANEADRPLTLTITLPNTLARSTFPLELRIEAKDNNITPVDNVKTELGKSSFDGNSAVNTYFFVKTIEYSEYAALEEKQFSFNFVTVKNSGQTGDATSSNAASGAKHVTYIKVTENKAADEDHWFLDDDANASCELWCLPASVTGVSLNKEKCWLVNGTSEKLIATIEPRNATTLGLTWTSSNPSVATVESDGMVTSKAIGKTTITVRTEDGDFTDTCEVEVYVPVSSISLYAAGGSPSSSVTELQLASGDAYTLAANILPVTATYHDQVSWTSSDTNIATVSTTGEVTAVGPGIATITAAAVDGSGVYATCTVYVRVAVTGVSLNKSALTLVHHDSERLFATVAPSNASDKTVTWSTSDDTVATVSANGTVTAVGVGDATITATADGGHTAVCSVTVNAKPVTSIALSRSTLTLNRWASETLIATPSPADATDTRIEWVSSDPDVASVDANGVVTGVSTVDGSRVATIRATAKDGSGVYAECTVTVNYTAVNDISITEAPTIYLPIGNTQALHAVLDPVAATKQTVSWSSDNTGVASVDADGRVTGNNVGTATITVTADDNTRGTKSATCTVVVYVPVTSVTLNKSHGSTLIYVKTTETLTVTYIDPTNATGVTYTWSSSDDTIASVDGGVVTGIKAGNARITVTATDVAGNTATDYCDVEVSDTVVFNTYYRYNSGGYIYGDYSNSYNDATNMKTRGAINLVFAQRFYENPGNNRYVTLCYNNATTPSRFTVFGSTTEVSIKRITITYSASGYNGGDDCTSDPLSSTATTIHGGSGTTGIWTGSSNSVEFTIYRESGTTGNRPRISSIEVVYE